MRKSKPTFFQYLFRRIEIFRDKLNGLDFLSVIDPKDLGLDPRIVSKGSPSANIYLANILRDCQITNADSILDIGCAKGAALYLMSQYEFAKADGIEISSKLSSIAKSNFLKLGINNVNIYNIDARNFQDYANYNFLYLYNPCPENIIKEIFQSIQKQVNNLSETIIIYNNPICHDLIEKFNFIKIGDYPDMWGNGINIYSNRPQNSRLNSNLIIK